MLLHILKYCNSVYTVCVYLSGLRAFVHDSYVSQRQHEKPAEKKVLLSENVQIKIILDV